MNIVFEYEGYFSGGTVYYYGLNRTHNSEGEIYVYNAHGDVVQLVKDNAVEVSYTYDAFGNLIEQIGESDNPFLYCGEYFDAETGTYYLRARYYNPANGRFTQQDAWTFMDASDPLSLNLYTYCCNNPVMYVDPSGHIFGEILLGCAMLFCVAATLSSCTQLEGSTFDCEELYDPKSPVYDHGTFNKNEAIQTAANTLYDLSYKKEKDIDGSYYTASNGEYGIYVYYKLSYNPVTQKEEPRYFSSQHQKGEYESVTADVKDYEIEEGATLVAFLHSHPYTKRNDIVFCDLDVAINQKHNIDSYVIDPNKDIFILPNWQVDPLLHQKWGRVQ